MMGHNTELFEQSYTHNYVLIFNKLSSEIKNIEPITEFKNILLIFLIKKSFYTGEEFFTVVSYLVNCK